MDFTITPFSLAHESWGIGRTSTETDSDVKKTKTKPHQLSPENLFTELIKCGWQLV